VADSGEGDLRGVEELSAIFVLDNVDEHPVRGAGDEITDAFVIEKRGHGVPIGRVSFVRSEDVFFTFQHLGLVAFPPGVPAARDGGVGEGRTGSGAGFEQAYSGQGHGEFSFPLEWRSQRR